MSDPNLRPDRPLAELNPAERALLAQARAVQPVSAALLARGVRRLEDARAGEAGHRRRGLPLALAALSLGICAVVVGRRVSRERSAERAMAVAPPPIAAAPQVVPPPPRSPEPTPWIETRLGTTAHPIGTLRTTPQTQLRLEPALVELDDGKLCAEIAHRDLAHEGPFVVRAPGMRVIVIGTRFCVETRGGQSIVSVEEGRVRVEGLKGEVAMVSAGEEARSESLAELPGKASSAKVGPAPTVRAGCPASGPLSVREDCIARAAEGSGLPAQNALFKLAVLARDQGRDGRGALAYFRALLGRFPESPLAADASLGSLAELRAEHRDAEALTEADRYLSRYASTGRGPEVELVRANLLRDRLGRPKDAVAGFAHVLAQGVSPALHDEAQFGLALAEAQLGERPAEIEALRNYLRDHPTGAHAPEAAAQLAQLAPSSR